MHQIAHLNKLQEQQYQAQAHLNTDSSNQNIWRCACTHCTPASYTNGCTSAEGREDSRPRGTGNTSQWIAISCSFSGSTTKTGPSKVGEVVTHSTLSVYNLLRKQDSPIFPGTFWSHCRGNVTPISRFGEVARN